MTSDQQALLTVVVYVGGVLLVRAVAKWKGYNHSRWALAAVFFWPAPLLFLLFMPKNRKLFRRCADCGSTDIPFNAPVCKHCGRDERVQASEKPPSGSVGAREPEGGRTSEQS